ncbi:hypothetical protein pipiens_012129 [Culex pipiens pipiens]|uniref:Uncharacterized protein n=1 Tax=Culex pipiens pipiens TaxID=38569 RepID=A0ABD1D3J6_CULPP
MLFRRYYPALSIKLDAQNANEMMKNLRLINEVCPQPRHLKLESWSADQRFGWVLKNTFFNCTNVEQLHLVGTCKTESGYFNASFDKLNVLKVESLHVEYLGLSAPNLNELHLRVDSEDHMDLLPQFADQLIKLAVVFASKEVHYFYNLKFPQLIELRFDRKLKGMTKSEQDISIAFFKRLKHLRRLTLSTKFIDSYVMQMISGSISNLTELKLEVSEGTIELFNISKLQKLEFLLVVAEKVNLLGAKFRTLKHLELGSSKLASGTYVYAFEDVMLLNKLRTLNLHNVKFYPEVLKLTPSYNVESMQITHYKRLEENHLQILVRRFPAIRWLKIASCPGFTQREVEKLKRMNPKMCVAFDEISSARL